MSVHSVYTRVVRGVKAQRKVVAVTVLRCVRCARGRWCEYGSLLSPPPLLYPATPSRLAERCSWSGTQSVCLLCAVRAYSLFVQETQILSIQLTGNVNGVRHTFLFLAGGDQG